jgi:carboxypeptidase Q
MKLTRFLFFLLFIAPVSISAQPSSAKASEGEKADALFLKQIHDHVLRNGNCYRWLEVLSEDIGGRLTGSANADEAVRYTAEQLRKFADSVSLQLVEVPHWIRGPRERAQIINLPQGIKQDLNVTALGNSIGTGSEGVSGEVIEVQSLDEVRNLGKSKISGKIVFYNRPMDPTMLRTFFAYGGAVDQRVNGPAVAAENGAIATIVRSMTTLTDNVPHTGTTRYKEGIPQIPAVAVSTRHADFLSKFIKRGKTEVYLETHCQMLKPSKSHNVIAEVKGSEVPDEIILVGGHLDSWDLGGGAHDDGAGCVHAMEVLSTFKRLKYRPKRTIRVVLFMNEENGLAGGREYASTAKEKGEFHLAALESDAGGFTPRGFSCDAEDDVFANYYRQITEWSSLLEPYGLYFTKGGAGADISRLKDQKGFLIGFRPDSQRYFDYHHTANDRLAAVNERELKLGAAAITSLIYLIDKYGFER